MKQLTIKSKIVCAITILIIVAGIIMTVIKGFKFDLKNQNYNLVELNIEKQIELADIKQMTKESLDSNEFIVQNVEMFNDAVIITAKEITEEQKNTLVQKVNEKYSTELKEEDIEIENIPNVRLRDIVKPYIIPLAISTAIILVYIGVKYYKIGIIKSIIKAGIILALAELTLFSIMSITRFPIGRFTLLLTLAVYIGAIIGITMNFEKLLKENKEEEQILE